MTRCDAGLPHWTGDATRRAVLRYLRTYKRLHDYAPSIREIQEAAGLKSPHTAHAALKWLREMGLVDWIDGEARTIHLTPDGEREARP